MRVGDNIFMLNILIEKDSLPCLNTHLLMLLRIFYFSSTFSVNLKMRGLEMFNKNSILYRDINLNDYFLSLYFFTHGVSDLWKFIFHVIHKA